MSAFGDRVEIVDLLLAHRIDVNFAAGVTQKRAITCVLWVNAHNCLRFLLEHGLVCSLNPRKNTTVLYIVAMDSDVETMEILADSAIRRIDYDAKDPNGKTARELLKNRADYTPELNEAFEALILSIRTPIKESDSKPSTPEEEAEDMSNLDISRVTYESSSGPLHETSSSEVSESDSDNEGEVFEDAQEHLNQE